MARRRVEPVPPPGRIEREERERAERRREEEARRIGEADIKRRRAEYKKARKDEEMLLAAAKRKKNRPYLFISGAFLLLFISLIGYLAYFNVVMRDRILANPYNKRQETLNEYVIRGDAFGGVQQRRLAGKYVAVCVRSRILRKGQKRH